MLKQSRAIVITGTSTGIGRATALRLAQRGLNVYATARDTESIADLAQEGCKTLALDVTDEASMQSAVNSVVEQEGAIGVLINNAGYSQSGAIESVPMAKVRAQFETNVFGLVRLCQLALPGMRQQGWGKIINLSSMGGKFTFPGAGFYHATKYAVESLSDALRFEVQDFGIDVIVIEPGLITSNYASTVTEQMTSLDQDGPYRAFNADIERITRETYTQGPLRRLGGEPERVAEVIEKAMLARHPKTRYTVTPPAKLLLAIRAVVSDNIWDRLSGFVFPRPGKHA